MVEAVIPIVLAAFTGAAALNNKVHNRISEQNKEFKAEFKSLYGRVDSVELRVAEQYVSKADLEGMLDRVEGHLIRLENKLDKLTFSLKSTLQLVILKLIQ